MKFINKCIVSVGTLCISQTDGCIVSLGTLCISQADRCIVALGTPCISQRMDGIQHISIKIKILSSLQQDFDGRVLEGRQLHYRHEKIKYRRRELVCGY